jgi:hypothetical protein
MVLSLSLSKFSIAEIGSSPEQTRIPESEKKSFFWTMLVREVLSEQPFVQIRETQDAPSKGMYQARTMILEDLIRFYSIEKYVVALPRTLSSAYNKV